MSVSRPSTRRFAGLATVLAHVQISDLFDAHRTAQRTAADQWGRSESLDPDDVGDIADEGVGHRG
jgi:hypothetical protein